MIFELSLMAISAFLMTLLLLRKTPIANVRQKADPVLHQIHTHTGRVFSGFNAYNAVLIANHIFVVIIRLFLHVSHRVHRTSLSIVEKASKKREDLTRSGAASFYLKQINKERETSEEEQKM